MENKYKEIYLSLAICLFFGLGAVLGKDFECKPEQGSKLSELLGDQEKLPMSCQMDHDIDEIVRQQMQQSNTLKLLGLVMDAMAEEIIELRNKSKKLENELASMRNLPTAKNETNGRSSSWNASSVTEFCDKHEGILYGNTCLWEEERPEKMTLVEAYRKCNKVTPSKLPEFYNEEQYNQLMNFLRSKLKPRGLETDIRIWTGLTRHHSTGEAFLSSGEPAPYVNIMDLVDRWDVASSYQTNVYINTRTSQFSVYNGLGAEALYATFEDEHATLICQTLPPRPEPEYKTEEDKVWCQNVGGIAYNGSCLWAEETFLNVMTLSRALEICNGRSPSKLPDVYGGQEYIDIMEYMRTKIKRESNFAWTAMTRNLTTSQAMLSDGTPAPYTRPRTDDTKWDVAADTRTNVYLYALTDTEFEDQGMGSIWPTYEFEFESEEKIVLCQKL